MSFSDEAQRTRELQREETGQAIVPNLQCVVAVLADPMAWNWCENFGNKRQAADAALDLMARMGLIEHHQHPLGGNIWKVGEKSYGRIDEDCEKLISSLDTPNVSGASKENE